MSKQMLDDLLTEVSENVPFYRNLINHNIEDYPFITKEAIKNNYGEFISDKVHNKESVIKSLNSKMDIQNYVIEKSISPNLVVEWTTGSSGVPFKSIKSKEERARISLNIWKRRRRINKNITPSSFFPLIHTGQHSIPFDIRDYSIENLKELYSFINRTNQVCIHATPNLLKRHIQNSKANKEIFHNTIDYIECTGQYLSEEDKLFFERTFNAEVLNAYGLIETWTIAYSCKNGRLHIINDSVYIEIVDENLKPIKENNKIGQIAVTALHQYTMPFIRYLTGDFAQYEENQCSCGETSRVIGLQKNRKINYLTYGDKIINGNDFVKRMLNYVYWQHEFHDINHICLIQKNGEFTFFLNRASDYQLFERLMTSIMKKELNPETKVEFLYVSLSEFEQINSKNHLFINQDKFKHFEFENSKEDG